MKQIVRILSKEHLTHDVIHFIVEKPSGISYIPGQAVDVSINKAGLEGQLRPFTFISLPDEDTLAFAIKIYPTHHGVTEQLSLLNVGDELIIGEVFGDIHFKDEGLFIAGGAGITPFIAIFNQLEKDHQIDGNKLLFANKTKADIILEDKFEKLLGKNFVNILSDEKLPNYEFGHVNADIIKKCLDSNTQYVYLCGPEPMMDAVEKQLAELGFNMENLVKEAF